MLIRDLEHVCSVTDEYYSHTFQIVHEQWKLSNSSCRFIWQVQCC